MNRWKQVAIRSGIVLLVLGGTTLLWYQARYARPLAAPMERVLPKGYSPSAPNGYDTLKEAIILLEDPKLHLPKRPEGSSAERMAKAKRFLVANQPFLKKTRLALTQPFLAADPYPYDVYHFYPRFQLQLLSLLYAGTGDVPEGLRCALDLVELGALIPSGGDFHDREDGSNYYIRGRAVAWFLAERVDASAAREAVARLDKIEKRRWPLSESLREELRRKQVGSRLNAFGRGPVALWRALSSDRSVRGKNEPKDLWEQVKTVSGGPQSLMDSWGDWVERARKRLEQPWNPARPALTTNSGTDPITGAVSADLYGLSAYQNLELEEYLYRTDIALLRTYLIVQAYKEEQGSYPDSLETLVAKGYLNAVPTDPFSPTRAPLRYRKNDDDMLAPFTLWSLGPDATDNDGETVQRQPGAKNDKQTEWFEEEGSPLPGDVVACQTFFPRFY